MTNHANTILTRVLLERAVESLVDLLDALEPDVDSELRSVSLTAARSFATLPASDDNTK